LNIRRPGGHPNFATTLKVTENLSRSTLSLLGVYYVSKAQRYVYRFVNKLFMTDTSISLVTMDINISLV
jgi:hypothetical protein